METSYWEQVKVPESLYQRIVQLAAAEARRPKELMNLMFRIGVDAYQPGSFISESARLTVAPLRPLRDPEAEPEQISTRPPGAVETVGGGYFERDVFEKLNPISERVGRSVEEIANDLLRATAHRYHRDVEIPKARRVVASWQREQRRWQRRRQRGNSQKKTGSTGRTYHDRRTSHAGQIDRAARPA